MDPMTMQTGLVAVDDNRAHLTHNGQYYYYQWSQLIIIMIEDIQEGKGM